MIPLYTPLSILLRNTTILLICLFSITFWNYSKAPSENIEIVCIDEPPIRVTMGVITPLVEKKALKPSDIAKSENDGVTTVAPLKKVPRYNYSDYQGIIWFLKTFEQFSPKAFWDHKQFTFGWGNKAPNKDATISFEEASSLLITDINNRYNKLLSKYPNLKRDRLTALVLTNLMFNIGKEKGGLARAIKNYDPDDIKTKKVLCIWIKKYVNASGKKLPGLIKRRKAEVELIMADEYQKQELFEKYRKENVKLFSQYN